MFLDQKSPFHTQVFLLFLFIFLDQKLFFFRLRYLYLGASEDQLDKSQWLAFSGWSVGTLVMMKGKLNEESYFLHPQSLSLFSGSTSIAVYATTLLIYRLLKMKCQVSVPYIPSIGHISHLSHILNTIYSIQNIFHSTYIPFTIY